MALVFILDSVTGTEIWRIIMGFCKTISRG